MTNKASDELYEEVRRFCRTEKAAHNLTEYIRQKLQEAQHNCNVADDQPNDVHIKYFNEGYRKGVADMETKLQEVERVGALQALINVWKNYEYEIAKRDLSSDSMPEGFRKMTDKEILSTVIAQLTNTSGKEQG